MDNKDRQMIEDISKEVRREYRNFVTHTLGEKDALKEQPAPVIGFVPFNPEEVSEPEAALPIQEEPGNTSHKKKNANSNVKLRTLNKKNRIFDVLFFTIILFLIVVLTAAMLQYYFVGSTIIVSGDSMEPTYFSGTEVWLNKTRTPQRGDVVVLFKNEVDNRFLAEFSKGRAAQSGGPYEKLIKRIVAVGGDELWVEEKDNNYVLKIRTPEGVLEENYYTIPGTNDPALFYDAADSDSNLVTVPYLYFKVNKTLTLGVLEGTTSDNPLKIGKDDFFFIGDNRMDSHDARDMGAFPLDRIIGVVDRVIKLPDKK